MSDVLSWIGWLLWSLLAFLWSIVWLLLGGWVATAAQILFVLLALFVYRYGWRRAPAELARQAVAVWRFASGAMRASEAMAAADAERRRERERERAAVVSRAPRAARHAGDVTINLSTTLSVTVLIALWMLSLL